MATNEAFFFDADMYEAHDALVCIARGEYVANDNREKYSPNQRLKTAAEMVALFADLPEAVANTINIAKRCNYVLQYVDPLLPIFECPEGKTQNEYTARRSLQGAGAQDGNPGLFCGHDGGREKRTGRTLLCPS